ncbi:MAG TPA: LptA/OstA family protein [Xanthobacteraceae bacterium]|nr:LptA/OstA family protein [Xanthobacteraceae bacterium]
MMRAPRHPLLAALAAAAILAAGLTAASAQPKPARQPPAPEPSGPRNALQGFTQNRNEPVKITSVSLDVRDRNKMATFAGNVQLVQGDTTLRCKTLVVYYDGDDASRPPGSSAPLPGAGGNSQIRRMEAKGDVVVTQKDQTATGDSAIFDAKDNTVRLYPPSGGTVVVSQGPNVVRGPRLVVHLDTGVSHFEGGIEMYAVPSQHPSGAPGAPPAPAAPGKVR